MNKRDADLGRWVIVLIITLAATILVSLLVGAAPISLSELIAVIRNSGGDPSARSIVLTLRLPRILLGFAVGSALSVAGVILQGMFRNPLVEPYTLGISGGAALGVCAVLVFHLHRSIGVIAIPLSGFIGAAGIVAIVYMLGSHKGFLNINNLLLSGVMISFICSSLFMLIMAVMRVEDLQGIVFWTMGSLSQPNWLLIKIMALVSLCGLGAVYLGTKELNALSLGQEEALHLGVGVESAKRLLFLLASLLTGCSVAVAGVIGFIGLIVPHCVRVLVGSDHRRVLILSYLAGGTFLILSDTIARSVIAPLELPVGVITGIIGGGIFIAAVSRQGART